MCRLAAMLIPLPPELSPMPVPESAPAALSISVRVEENHESGHDPHDDQRLKEASSPSGARRCRTEPPRTALRVGKVALPHLVDRLGGGRFRPQHLPRRKIHEAGTHPHGGESFVTANAEGKLPNGAHIGNARAPDLKVQLEIGRVGVRPERRYRAPHLLSRG